MGAEGCESPRPPDWMGSGRVESAWGAVDLFNFVHDPATLIVAFDRVAGNTGSRTAGVDGLTVTHVEEQVGVPEFLEDLRARLRGQARSGR